MQVKFRQTTRNGCASLSIANLFDDHRFTVNLEGLPGERIGDLNKKMIDNGMDFFVDCLFLTHKVFRTGNRLQLHHDVIFRYQKKGMTKHMRQNYAVPYLITVANGKGRIPHMVGVYHNLSDGLFHWIDSTKPEIMIFTFRELVARFHIMAVSVFRIWDNPDQSNFLLMDKKELGHIFTV